MQRLDALAQTDRRRRAAELALGLLCALGAGLAGARAALLGHVIIGWVGVVVAVGLAVQPVRRWRSAALGPGVIAARLDGARPGAPEIGLILTAHEAAAGRAQGAADLAAHTIAAATAALDAIDGRRAVPALQPPLVALGVLALLALAQPLRRAPPAAAEVAPSGTESAVVAAGRAAAEQLDNSLLGAIVARASGDGSAPGQGSAGRPAGVQGGLDGATVAAGDAGAGAGAAAGLGAADPTAKAGASQGEGGASQAMTVADEAAPEADRPLERPVVDEAVHLLDKGHSAVNDGEVEGRGAEAGDGPRQDAAGSAETELKGGEVEGNVSGPSGGERMSTEAAPEAGDQPSEAGSDSPGVNQKDEGGPQVQDLDERVTWETPGGRPGQGGANDAAGTDNQRERGEATEAESVDERLTGGRSGGQGGLRAESEDGQNALGEANDTTVARAEAAEAEAARAAARPPAARRAWLEAALQPAASAAPPTIAPSPPEVPR